MTTLPIAVLDTLREERLRVDVPDRALTARHVLAIVAAFANQIELSERAAAGQVDCQDGELAAYAAERQVRALAVTAEGTTLQVTGSSPCGDVVSGILSDECLLDDYLRIRAVEQHLAFDEPMTDAERDALVERREQRAAEVLEAARLRIARRRDDLRVCLCGHDYGRHRRNLDQLNRRLDFRVCARFLDADEHPVSRMAAESLPAVARSWAARREVDELDEAQVADAVRLLESMRAVRTGTVTTGEALAVVAAALDWPTGPA